jgi:hypothetical protein
MDVTLNLFLFVRACLQRSGGSSSGVREFLEGFLCNWSLVDGKYHVLVAAEADVDAWLEGCDGRYLLEGDKYGGC